jgi:hypothetical protein
MTQNHHTLDTALWLAFGAECDNAAAPNAAEDDYAAGYIAGLAKAQQLMRRTLKAAGVRAEYGVSFNGSEITPADTFDTAEAALAHAGGIKSGVYVRDARSWSPAFQQPAEKGLINV